MNISFNKNKFSNSFSKLKLNLDSYRDKKNFLITNGKGVGKNKDNSFRNIQPSVITFSYDVNDNENNGCVLTLKNINANENDNRVNKFNDDFVYLNTNSSRSLNTKHSSKKFSERREKSAPIKTSSSYVFTRYSHNNTEEYNSNNSKKSYRKIVPFSKLREKLECDFLHFLEKHRYSAIMYGNKLFKEKSGDFYLKTLIEKNSNSNYLDISKDIDSSQMTIDLKTNEINKNSTGIFSLKKEKVNPKKAQTKVIEKLANIKKKDIYLTPIPKKKKFKEKVDKKEFHTAERTAVLIRRIEYSSGIKKNSKEAELNNFKLLLESKTTIIQRWWRKQLFKKVIKTLRVIIIQKYFRGHVTRMAYMLFKKLRQKILPFLEQINFTINKKKFKLAFKILKKNFAELRRKRKYLKKIKIVQRIIRMRLAKRKLYYLKFLQKFFFLNIFLLEPFQIIKRYSRQLYINKITIIQKYLRRYLLYSNANKFRVENPMVYLFLKYKGKCFQMKKNYLLKCIYKFKLLSYSLKFKKIGFIIRYFIMKRFTDNFIIGCKKQGQYIENIQSIIKVIKLTLPIFDNCNKRNSFQKWKKQTKMTKNFCLLGMKLFYFAYLYRDVKLFMEIMKYHFTEIGILKKIKKFGKIFRFNSKFLLYSYYSKLKNYANKTNLIKIKLNEIIKIENDKSILIKKKKAYDKILKNSIVYKNNEKVFNHIYNIVSSIKTNIFNDIKNFNYKFYIKKIISIQSIYRGYRFKTDYIKIKDYNPDLYLFLKFSKSLNEYKKNQFILNRVVKKFKNINSSLKIKRLNYAIKYIIYKDYFTDFIKNAMYKIHFTQKLLNISEKFNQIFYKLIILSSKISFRIWRKETKRTKISCVLGIRLFKIIINKDLCKFFNSLKINLYEMRKYNRNKKLISMLKYCQKSSLFIYFLRFKELVYKSKLKNDKLKNLINLKNKKEEESLLKLKLYKLERWMKKCNKFNILIKNIISTICKNNTSFFLSYMLLFIKNKTLIQLKKLFEKNDKLNLKSSFKQYNEYSLKLKVIENKKLKKIKKIITDLIKTNKFILKLMFNKFRILTINSKKIDVNNITCNIFKNIITNYIKNLKKQFMINFLKSLDHRNKQTRFSMTLFNFINKLILEYYIRFFSNLKNTSNNHYLNKFKILMIAKLIEKKSINDKVSLNIYFKKWETIRSNKSIIFRNTKIFRDSVIINKKLEIRNHLLKSFIIRYDKYYTLLSNYLAKWIIYSTKITRRLYEINNLLTLKADKEDKSIRIAFGKWKCYKSHENRKLSKILYFVNKLEVNLKILIFNKWVKVNTRENILGHVIFALDLDFSCKILKNSFSKWKKNNNKIKAYTLMFRQITKIHDLNLKMAGFHNLLKGFKNIIILKMCKKIFSHYKKKENINCKSIFNKWKTNSDFIYKRIYYMYYISQKNYFKNIFFYFSNWKSYHTTIKSIEKEYRNSILNKINKIFCFRNNEKSFLSRVILYDQREHVYYYFGKWKLYSGLITQQSEGYKYNETYLPILNRIIKRYYKRTEFEVKSYFIIWKKNITLLNINNKVVSIQNQWRNLKKKSRKPILKHDCEFFINVLYSNYHLKCYTIFINRMKRIYSNKLLILGNILSNPIINYCKRVVFDKIHVFLSRKYLYQLRLEKLLVGHILKTLQHHRRIKKKDLLILFIARKTKSFDLIKQIYFSRYREIIKKEIIEKKATILNSFFKFKCNYNKNISLYRKKNMLRKLIMRSTIMQITKIIKSVKFAVEMKKVCNIFINFYFSNFKKYLAYYKILQFTSYFNIFKSQILKDMYYRSKVEDNCKFIQKYWRTKKILNINYKIREILKSYIIQKDISRRNTLLLYLNRWQTLTYVFKVEKAVITINKFMYKVILKMRFRKLFHRLAKKRMINQIYSVLIQIVNKKSCK